MDQLLREFLAEAEDLIEALFRDIEALRLKHAEGRARRELTGRIFRHVHTLKGTAASAGLDVASRIAHDFETLLDGVRRGSLTVDEPLLDAFDDAAHALAQTLDATARGAAPSLPLQLLESLRLFTRSDASQSLSPPASTTSTHTLLPEEIARTLGAEDARRVHEATAEGQSLFVIHVTFDLETFDHGFRELSARLSQSGELISTLPGLLEAAPGAISLRLLYAGKADAEELNALCQKFGSISIEALEPAPGGLSDEAAGEFDEEAITPGSSAGTIAPLPTQVRVELGTLDALISAAHELMAETSVVLELALAAQRAGTGERSRNVEQRASLVHQRFIELEEQLIGLRRVPLARTLERAARAGAQAARSTGKNVEFEIAGGDIRLDKSLVEAINDPLLHLVRNAVDHGIEPRQKRASAGKSEAGVVRLEATEDVDRIILRVTDDGRGIELDSISRAAAERGIIEAGRSVSRHQALRLIFRPGFSTAAAVSETSGRGVGLDVVERAIEQIGGEMRVWSETGRGTTFEMSVPVALALLPALVVTSAGFCYCVDARRVSETLIVKVEDVRRDDERELIDWRGAALPLVHLRQFLGQPAVEAGSAESWNVIILATAARETVDAQEEEKGAGARVALAVDGWNECRAEVLVRRLGAHSIRWQGVGGAAELSDGQLALVLDLPRLLET
jgi:two-component system chemotaxis sensor kinase CheA